MPDTVPPIQPPRQPPAYDGRTYYGRPALKAAPFEKWVVGGYIFLAGLSGAAQMLSTVVDLFGRAEDDETVSDGRRLSMLAPTVGSALLVYDLNTPKRFYNMLRIAKSTSPMSIGTWILMTFSAFSGATAGLDLLGKRGMSGALATVTQLPAAAAGAGLSTYTAALLSATSTPLWAAAPKALAVRFAGSSMAAGAAALSALAHLSGRRRRARDLDNLMLASLAVELAAASASKSVQRAKGLSAHAEATPLLTAAELGAWVPFGLHVLAAMSGQRAPGLRLLASGVALAGSLCLRVGILGAGQTSANTPQEYFRFARPENLPAK